MDQVRYFYLWKELFDACWTAFLSLLYFLDSFCLLITKCVLENGDYKVSIVIFCLHNFLLTNTNIVEANILQEALIIIMTNKFNLRVNSLVGFFSGLHAIFKQVSAPCLCASSEY
ncbi:hypothetical protein ACJX0J_014430 [Zea mays]